VQICVGLLNSLRDWVIIQFWKSLVEFAEVFHLFVGCSEILVGLLIKLFEVVGVLVIFTLEFDVESFHIGNEESSEDLIQFFDRNFLESILKKASNILDGLRLLINIVSLKVGPVLISFAS
jgi:hypothetical protein